MNRRQRRDHARTWPWIALALIVVMGAAIAAKVHTDTAIAQAQLSGQR